MASQANNIHVVQAEKSTKSHLLNLIPELRNAIYGEVLVSDKPFETNPELGDTKRCVSQLQLLHVCRQIRTEAYAIFWSENTFRATVREGQDIGRSYKWISRIGPNNAALISRLLIYHYCSEENMLKTGQVVEYIHINTMSLDFLRVARNVRRLVVAGVPPGSIRGEVGPPCNASTSVGELFWSIARKLLNGKIRDVSTESVDEMRCKVLRKHKKVIRELRCGRFMFNIEDEA